MNLPARILLVEDDPGDARLVLAVLEELELAEQTCVVADGTGAMDYLHGHARFSARAPGAPAVILLDLKMPRLNGFEVLTLVRADPLLRRTPVVVLSSSGEESDLRRAYDCGANGYVVKGIDFGRYRSNLRALGQYWALANEPPPGAAVCSPSTLPLAAGWARRDPSFSLR